MAKFSSLITFVLIFSAILVDAKVQRKNVAHKGQVKKMKAQPNKGPQHVMGAKLGTNFNFSDAAVRGQYQSAFSAQATVENEKPIEDLLDYRSNFNDRIAVANEQR